jgi:hypothetical protein
MNSLSNDLDNDEPKRPNKLQILEGTEKGPNNNLFRGLLKKFKRLSQSAASRT